jgi:hypothetical protein
MGRAGPVGIDCQETDMKGRYEDLALQMQGEELEIRGEEWGEMVVRQLTLPAGTDFTPLLEGLPDDLCPTPHWGRVLEGEMHIRYADGTEEVTRAGEFFYWPARHTGWTEGGVIFIEVSPAEQTRRVTEHVNAKRAG